MTSACGLRAQLLRRPPVQCDELLDLLGEAAVVGKRGADLSSGQVGFLPGASNVLLEVPVGLDDLTICQTSRAVPITQARRL